MPFAFVGAAGNAILFVVCLVLWTYLAAYTVSLASHCYLVVVQGTVAGVDRVHWPDEPIYDRLLQAATLLGLAALWVVPIGILSRALGPHWMPEQPALRLLILAVPGLWLFFPFILLSSLASVSRWQIFNIRVIVGLLGLAPQLLLFYAFSGVALGGAVALGFTGLFTTAWYALPIAAVLGSAAFLIHGRLLGRLGWLLQQRVEAAEPRVSKKANRATTKKRPRKSRAVAVRDPWAVREEEEDESPPAEPGYRIVEVEPKKAPRPAYMDPEPDPYTLADEPESVAPAPPRLELNQAQVEREIELRTRTPPNPPPRIPMVSGVWTFPGYESSRKAWVNLAVWGLFTGAVTRGLILFYPY